MRKSQQQMLSHVSAQALLIVAATLPADAAVLASEGTSVNKLQLAR